MKKISEMTPGEALTEQALAGRFTRRGVSECRKSASIIARSA